MIKLILLIPSLLMIPKASCDRITTDDILMFEVFNYSISFDKNNTTEFFDCICSDNITCLSRTINYTNKIEILTTVASNDVEENDTLNNTFQCALNSYFFKLNEIHCRRPTSRQVFNLNFTMFSCSSHEVNLTWEACTYSVTCKAKNNTKDIHDYPGTNCIDSQTSLTISHGETTSMAYIQQNSTAVIVTQISPVAPDDKLPLIIGVTVSVGVLVILSVIAVVIACRRRKRAVQKRSCFQNYKDSTIRNITENIDAAKHDGNSKLSSHQTVEPYAVIEFNEELEFSNVSKDANLECEQQENNNNKYTTCIRKCYEHSPNHSSSENGKSVYPILDSKSLIGASNESNGLVYSKLGERVKDTTNVYDALPVLDITGSQECFHKPSSDAHIYFELEKEVVLKEFSG